MDQFSHSKGGDDYKEGLGLIPLELERALDTKSDALFSFMRYLLC